MILMLTNLTQRLLVRYWFILLILTAHPGLALAVQTLNASVSAASNYNFRGLYQHFNENNEPSSRMTVHSSLAFWSESGFMLGGQSANVHNDFEIQGQAGFKLPLSDGDVSLIYHQFQYQTRPNFEEVHYALQTDNAGLTYVQGLAQAGDAYWLDYAFTSPEISAQLQVGHYDPSLEQLGLNEAGNGDFYTVSLAQNYFNVKLSIAYTSRYNLNDSTWIVSIGSQWDAPLVAPPS